MNQTIRFFFLATSFTWHGCVTNKTPHFHISGLTMDLVKIENGSLHVDSEKLIRRQCENLVNLCFFEVFNDTVIVYVNGKEKDRLFVHEKNNPYTSNGYSGVCFQQISSKRKNIVTLQLLKQGRYIQFMTDTKYPLYIIQKYGETWYVRSTLENLNLK